MTSLDPLDPPLFSVKHACNLYTYLPLRCLPSGVTDICFSLFLVKNSTLYNLYSVLNIGRINSIRQYPLLQKVRGNRVDSPWFNPSLREGSWMKIGIPSTVPIVPALYLFLLIEPLIKSSKWN